MGDHPVSTSPASLRLADHRRTESASAPDFAPVARRIHRSLEERDVARAVADDGRRWSGWDRVSVLLRTGQRWRVLAISGQEIIAPRAPTTVRLSALVRQVLRSGRAWSFDRSEPADLPQATETLLADYLAAASPHRLQIEPLFPAIPSEESEPENVRRQAPFAALVFEDFANTPVDSDRAARTTALVQQGTLGLLHSRRWGRIWLRPLLAACGEFWAAMSVQRWILAVLGIGAAAGLFFALATIPADLKIDATGRLMPVAQARVYAPADGEVTELLVAGGDRVEAGQPLLTLWDATLSEEVVVTRSRLAEAEQGLQGAKAELHEISRASGERSELARLQTRVTQLQIEIEGLRRQLVLLDAEAERLTVRAPAAGVITTPDLRDRLLSRPLRRGDLLLELADDAGAWQLELLVPEREFGKFLRTSHSVDPQSAAIEFRRLAQPARVHAAAVVEIGARTVVIPDVGPCIPVTARVDAAADFARQIGADIEARLRGPQSTLGEALFGEFVDALYRWSWW